MRNLKKKLVALGLALATMASSVMSMSAFASTAGTLNFPDPGIDDGRDWGMYYVPYSGGCYAGDGFASVQSLKWGSTQLQAISARYPDMTVSYEFEFRPVDSNGATIDPHTIWSKKSGAISSNFPNASFEFQLLDTDDVTIVFPDISKAEADTVYYATQNLISKENRPTDISYDFEIELGQKLPIISDSWPLRYTKYSEPISFGHWLFW